MNQLIWKSMLFSSLLTSSQIAFAEAESHKQRPQKKPRFDEVDLNSDGLLTLDEFKQHRMRKKKHERIFNHMDQDQNGMVSQEEFHSHKPPKRKHKTKQLNSEQTEPAQ